MPVAENWSQLRAELSAGAERDKRRCREQAEDLPLLLAQPATSLNRLFDTNLEICIWLALGAEQARQHLLLREGLQAYAEHARELAEASPGSALHVLTYASVSRALGQAPQTAQGEAAMWAGITARATLLEERWKPAAAFAALAMNQPELIPRFDEGPGLTPRREPQPLQGPAFFGLARNLAELELGGGELGDASDAFQAVLRAFPLALAADAVDWLTLYWAAHVWLVRVEGLPPEDLGEALVALVGAL